MRTNPETMNELRRILEEWDKACEKNLQAGDSQNSYKRYARMFVRFAAGEFTPGETLRR